MNNKTCILKLWYFKYILPSLQFHDFLCNDAYFSYCKENSNVVHVLKHHEIKMHDSLVEKHRTFLKSVPGVWVACPCPVRDEDSSGQCSMQPSLTTTIIHAK
jgi:hypothetical protein